MKRHCVLLLIVIGGTYCATVDPDIVTIAPIEEEDFADNYETSIENDKSEESNKMVILESVDDYDVATTESMEAEGFMSGMKSVFGKLLGLKKDEDDVDIVYELRVIHVHSKTQCMWEKQVLRIRMYT